MMTVGEWLKKTFTKDKMKSPMLIAQVSAHDNTGDISLRGEYPKSAIGQFIAIVFTYQTSNTFVDIDDFQIPEPSQIINMRKERSVETDADRIMEYGIIVKEAVRVLTKFENDLDFSCVISNYVSIDDKDSEISISVKFKQTPDDSYDLLKSVVETLKYDFSRTESIRSISNVWELKTAFVYNTEGM